MLVYLPLTSYQQTLNLNVRENPVKYKFFAVIVAILQTVHSLTKYETPLQTSPRNGERL